MRQILILILFIIGLGFSLKGQELTQDSLFQIFLPKIPIEYRADLKAQFDTASSEDREFLLFILSMPSSSKSELIKNIDSNSYNILRLKEKYTKEITPNLKVYIEFQPANILLQTKESIDFFIFQEDSSDKSIVLFQQWNLDYNSLKLDSALTIINWTKEKLFQIKSFLKDANCISIENGEPTTIGFARSGMGKYSYKIFNQNLNTEQIEKYNDGCNYIFYKENIVLEYGGGAMGPQCFPDETE
ncbi:MAG: hypothetical protein PHC83_07670 [Bacteroidales bacterium]|nr:hypothetical protein [Bacteroidales bacterium]MDD4209556.1 hypothetical protein [Bacteroidales bacterium]